MRQANGTQIEIGVGVGIGIGIGIGIEIDCDPDGSAAGGSRTFAQTYSARLDSARMNWAQS
jgi:hypothetical protein